MRDIIVTEFISLDGVVDSPGGEPGYRHAGWTFDVEPDPAVYEIKAREAEDASALLLGRRSYDAFSAVWPEREEFASFNAMPKYVVSSTLTDPTWHNTRVLPNVTSTEPSAISVKSRWNESGRSWSAARPSGRVMGFSC